MHCVHTALYTIEPFPVNGIPMKSEFFMQFRLNGLGPGGLYPGPSANHGQDIIIILESVGNYLVGVEILGGCVAK